jgi:alpha-1,2-rhamnosyltransferase
MTTSQILSIHQPVPARTKGVPNSRTAPNRIVIDCTHTVRSGLQTGVQRVVRSLVREGEHFGQQHGRTVFGVVLGNTGFEKYIRGKDSEDHAPPPTLRDNVLHYLPSAYIRAAELLCSRIKSRRFRSWLLPKPGHLGIFKSPIKLIEGTQKLVGQNPRRQNELQLGKGDLLILPDAYWSKMEIWDHVRAIREQGVFVVVVLHDIIPLTHPQFVPPRGPANFRSYLQQAVANADLIVTVSQTIRDQLREMLPGIFPERDSFPPVEAFRNGADFEKSKEGTVRDELVKLFACSPQPSPYLSVSTFDPRKNHGFTLEAFEKLWVDGISARLMYVGGQGWMSEELLRKIETHPQLGANLFLYHDLTDAELYYCYQRARGTVSSSYVEGFGLPIVESLWHGRKTFASDTPIHREVGGDSATYFDLSSPQHLATAIAHWETALAGGAPIHQPNVRPMNWQESTSLLMEHCLAAFTAANSPAPSLPAQRTTTPIDGPMARVA